ncbi:MAG: phosphatase PAP2 family protein [Desulfobacteraceae bacterium]|nr:MAG: phosphatase PAP2 family protein [Desulfobacteraceae bacterium]
MGENRRRIILCLARPIKSLRRWGHELPALILLVLVIGLVWMFMEIADEVLEGEAHPLDRRLILAMRNPQDLNDPVGARWVEELGRDFTALGGIGVLTFITLGVMGYLLLHRNFRIMALVVIAVGGGTLLSFMLKSSFDRPRPDLVPHASYVYTASFPSGHSMMSAATYLTLGALLARVHPKRRTKAYILTVAVLTTFAVGISRIYMGVHWPSDVLGGWTLGAAWALLCWLVARWLQMRGQVEQEA